ncbi:MAG: Trk system potassium transporter TrkA [Bacteroidales bacterium]|nr:Trk system potassium transporter TrkA [Bacteroidales bacterium]
MKIIVAGAGAVGSHLAKMLSQENHDIVLIDPDEDKLRQVGSNLDVMTRTGSATSLTDLMDCGIKKTDLFISVARKEETNITACILGKRLGALKTIARIDNQEYLYAKHREHFTSMGIDYMIYPEKIASREVVGLLEQAGSTDIYDFSGKKLSLFVVKIDDESNIANKSLNEISSDDKKQEFRAVAINRKGETIIPKGDFIVYVGDFIYVIATKEGIDDLLEISGKKKFDIRNIMILGGSRIGTLTAKELGGQHNIKLIERDREKSYKLSNMLNNTLVVNGDGRDVNLLLEEGLEKMDAFIAVTGDSEINILSCMLARRMGVKKSICEVENIEYIALAEQMGIDTIINKKLITASRIFRFTTSETVSSVKCLTGTDAEVLEFDVKDNAKITLASLSEMNFPKDSIIGGIIRGESSFIANGYTLIKPGDKVVVFSLPSAISKVSKFFN